MNMQALMRQAQQMQKELTKAQEEINVKEFTGKNGIITVIITGNKNIKKIDIEKDMEVLEDTSLLSDMILLALNDAFNKADKYKKQKLGKYANAMQGLM